MIQPDFLALALGTIALAGAAPAPAADHQPAPETYYTYFKQRTVLPLDQSRIAVREADPAVRDAALRKAGIDPAGASAMPIPGWSWVALPQGTWSPAGVRTAVAGVAAAGVFAAPVFFGEDAAPMTVTPDVLCRFEAGVDVAGRGGVAPGGVIAAYGNMSGAYRIAGVSMNGFDVLEAANRLAEDRGVIFAEPDMIFQGRPDFIPNDTGFPSQWGLRNTGQLGGTPGFDMKVDTAWDLGMGSASILVGVFETGVQVNHPDLNVAPGGGVDVTAQGPGDGSPRSACENHGTAVAGCITAKINNRIGLAGIAPECRTFAVRFGIADTQSCNGAFSTSASWMVDGLTACEIAGVRVTNNSNGLGFQSAAIDSKYDQTRTGGMVHFASTGNDGDGVPIHYPARLPSVNACGAVNRFGDLADFSQRGAEIDFVAPGVQIYTTDRTGTAGYGTGDYFTVQGTSFATPNTAAVAALLLSNRPDFTAEQVEQTLKTTARDLGDAGWDNQTGWGMPDARAVMETVGCSPGITEQPQSQAVRVLQPVLLRVRSERANIGFQWYHDGQRIDLADPNFAGQTTQDLLIASFNSSYVGAYYCLVFSQCGATPSDVANLTIDDGGGGPGDCPADFNGDNFLDFFDFQSYVDCFEGVECPPGKVADFDGDEFVDFFDFQAFVEAFEAGC